MRLVVLASLCIACGLHNVEAAPDAVGSSEESASFCRDSDPKVDILFVIGDAPSMAREASVLAESLPPISAYLAGRLEVAFELRVAVTTTSTCDGAAGEFLTTSCRERLDDFVVPDTQDIRDSACTDVCALDSIERDPSLVEGSTTPQVRPWLQLGRYQNLAPDVDGADALTCSVPVGISGCATETPLRAMRSALDRTRDPEDPQHGFLRSDASLLVVIIADDEDDDSDASSYVGVLDQIQAEKRAIDPDLVVRIAVVGGVGVGYETGMSDAVDGCVINDEVTPPTPALVELAAAFAEPGERNTTSVCGVDYSIVLAPLAIPLRDELRPMCIPFCLADGDPSTPELDPVCHVRRTEIVGDAGVIEAIDEPLHPCLPAPPPTLVPPPGELRCIEVVRDAELEEKCLSEGLNASLRVISTAPPLPAGDTCIEVTCQVSLTPELDCPDL